jgi:GT2 family glycosyltransferase
MISVIIPTCNRNELLRKCLVQLAPSSQTIDASSYEVIVTDDSEQSKAKKLIVDEFPWAKWIEGPKKGPAANRNNGARKAKGDWLLFIDDDCLPNENILREYHHSSLINSNISVFEGRITADRLQRSFIEESPLNEYGGCLWSCNFMIDKQLFISKLQGFDEKFPYAAMEDVDLHYRLKKEGAGIIFLSNAWVIHPWRQQNNMVSITLKRFESTLYFLKKHPEMKSDINSLYYFRSFYNGFFKSTVKKSIEYKLRGISSKIGYDFLNLYFAIYSIFN